ncbi:peptide chain release factor N(5)-glutamine methyltransferase [Moraxella sp. Tifton1]|uniref:peptide chain release factor N(5)-glutamine methyltransferase n=1 Tax=Moraxella oculi TaxID=2940516 RepID=UPI0020126002|nr:peptide chain release factor N(5)-glutamine methyltransferase [Moraxella sp. Tifton1]MCL1622726.1 peptide chain release factor N(5)-glutamine methyltransferase [Moraxella sp. Tifton1]
MTIVDIKKAHRQSDLPRHWWQGWLCFVLDQSVSFLMTHEDYVLTPVELMRFNAGIDKMKDGVPLAYLTSEQEFFGRVFTVNEHTLIPRPDTERLVEVVLDWVREGSMVSGKILDLGTGSGCVAITLAKELPKWSVLAVDFSADALSVAMNNAKKLTADNCAFVQSDWYQNIHHTFDIIVSNPPYIADDDEHLAGLTAEPIMALVADDGGLADIRRIIHGAKKYLNKQGLLIIEHGHDQRQSVQAIFEQCGYQAIMTMQDYGGNDRLTMGVCDD